MHRDGDVVSTHDGEVIEGMDITGSVIVKHRGVGVRRNRIGLAGGTFPDDAHPPMTIAPNVAAAACRRPGRTSARDCIRGMPSSPKGWDAKRTAAKRVS